VSILHLVSHTLERPGLNLDALDAMRAIGAFGVVVWHARWLLWAPAGLSGPTTNFADRVLTEIWKGMTPGQDLVLLFFVMSGFGIHFRQARGLARGGRATFEVRAYAARRLRRLYPPLLLALTFTALIDAIGGHVNPGYYSGQAAPASVSAYLVQSSDHSLATLIGNIALQASLSVHTFGTNPALWMLSYQFWFYALYPVLLGLTVRFGPLRALVAVAAVSAISVGVLLLDGLEGWAWVPRVLAFWVVWAAGAFIADAYVGNARPRGLGPASVGAALILALLFINSLRPLVPIDDLVEGMLTAVALAVILAWAMLDCPRRASSAVARVTDSLAPLGRMSFSVYLVHGPILFLLAAWWLTDHATLPTGPELAAFGVALGLASALVCWFAIERHFNADRRRLTLVPAVAAQVQLTSLSK
jgi:peptidoglycan/LPS O-acetylase OafA/YrhL